ncbi:response regulator transcription factor [Niallia circulans]|uniref:response regulator transcription factor n=1 Tax=Niallia circulans TaxID=1397 RepID=UPI001F31A74E|nr:response regulator transcription factor [Niallia circulans]MCF2649333.1 response regulator transcription factor [Niallia circulans]
MEKILIIEDNEDVSRLLAEFLKDEGYEVSIGLNGMEGLMEAKKNQYNLILLDIMLPYKSGEEILKEIRAFHDIPIIIISAKDMVSTKIDLLRLGADDYITKPFNLGEVSARIMTNLRHYNSQKKANNVLKYRDLNLDITNKELTLSGVKLDLTAKEYLIMELLMRNPGKVYSKSNIYESLWNKEYLGDDNSVKTHISNLRNKLKTVNPDIDYVETVWGLGYRLYKA